MRRLIILLRRDIGKSIMRTENERKELTAYIETFIVDIRGIYPTGFIWI